MKNLACFVSCVLLVGCNQSGYARTVFTMERNALGEPCNTTFTTRLYEKGLTTQLEWEERSLVVSHSYGDLPCDHPREEIPILKPMGFHCECPEGFSLVGWEKAIHDELYPNSRLPICLQD